MFNYIENFFASDDNLSKHKDALLQTRTKCYECDKTILKNKVQQQGQYNFSGRFDYNDNELTLQCLYIDSKYKSLFISYNGARPKNFVNEPAFFSRWSYYKLVDSCFLGIDDPMYQKHPELMLGWFYGTKDKCYIDNTITMINEICKKKGIEQSRCTFFSSSGGGYASILGAIAIPDTISVSINPQLYIQDYALTKDFEKIVGINLNDKDVLLRNDLYNKIIKESRSKHVIIVNIQSEHDYSDVVKLANQFGTKQLRYGLNLVYKNVLIWIYDALPRCDETAHTAFETRPIFKFIEYVYTHFKNDCNFDPNDYQHIVSIVNEMWYDYSKLSSEKIISKDIENCICNFYLDNRPLFKHKIDNFVDLLISAKESNFNFFCYTFPSRDGKYTIAIKDIESNVSQYTYGLYDFSLKKFIKRFDVNTNEEQIFSFDMHYTRSVKVGLLIYAGICGETKNNYLKISDLSIFDSENKNE